MRILLLAWTATILSGCTHYANIIDFDLSRKNEDYIILKLVTNENLEDLKNSYWCYEPVIIYGVAKINGDEDFPFSVKGWKHLEMIGHDKYRTEWELPVKKKITIDETTYTYNYSDQNRVVFFVKLFGATMAGGHLDSDIVKAEIKK
jgi:hypothetical protein